MSAWNSSNQALIWPGSAWMSGMWIEQSWSVPEDRCVLLEEDADPAKEHVTAADVTFVGAGRCVDRRENDVVPTREELRREGVVAETAAAVHAAGPACQRQDPHATAAPALSGSGPAAWNERLAYRCSKRLPSCGWSQLM